LNERLALPFTRYFYYKKGTPGDREWKRKMLLRKTPARDVGVYNAYSESGWNDEVLVNDKTSEPESQVEALIRDAEGTDGEAGAKRETSQDIVVQRPLPRVTEQDQKGEHTSLNRLLDRTLYLLVKNKNGVWRFPEDEIKGPEGLDQVSLT
jgi:large subunit ribosomal protein L46